MCATVHPVDWHPMSTRARIYGVDLDLLCMGEVVDACRELIESRRPSQQTSLNAGKVVLMDGDDTVRSALLESDLLTADGQSIVWAGRLMGHSVPERVAGIDLMEQLLGLSEKQGYPVYFLGAKPAVLSRFVEIVRSRYPGLAIAGYADGYFEDPERAAELVGGSAARVLFLGIPSPKKEFFVSQQRDRLGPVLAVGVGGSFDVWAGVTKRAPIWMQRAGLEWFYRLIQEPQRMWRRYLVGNTRFLILTLKELRQGRSVERNGRGGTE